MRKVLGAIQKAGALKFRDASEAVRNPKGEEHIASAKQQTLGAFEACKDVEP